MLKLIELETALNILNPILIGKCKPIFALEIINLIDELEPELEKVNTIKKKMIEQYAIKKEDQSGYETNFNNGQEVFNFGENTQKVEEEMKEVMELEIDIKNSLDLSKWSNDIEIEPLNLKFLLDRGLVKK